MCGMSVCMSLLLTYQRHLANHLARREWHSQCRGDNGIESALQHDATERGKFTLGDDLLTLCTMRETHTI